MKLFTRLFLGACCAGLLTGTLTHAQERELPPDLADWQDWVLWDEGHRQCPTPYNDASKHLCYWQSKLALNMGSKEGTFRFYIQVFNEGWVSLPGDNLTWPMEVKVGGRDVAVVQYKNHPSIELAPGSHTVTGRFLWDNMPQKLRLPQSTGIVSLTLDGQQVPVPNWDRSGQLWLKRAQAEESDRDLITLKVHRMIRDGIPMWMETEVELRVSGKSREEELGHVLPVGWKLSQVDSSLPVAVDDEGQVKAQVRAGKWTVRLTAFRTDHPEQMAYAEAAKPLVETELVAFQSDPKFRMVEVRGLPQIDVAQTTFPQKWANLPIYEWKNATPFTLDERMRGMGFQKPEGLKIRREFWLDETGGGLTFLDRITGNMQQIWRLDVAPGRELGAVRIDGEGQLVTKNPETGVPGVEIRQRNLNLEAVGRMESVSQASATGWQTAADSVDATIHMPPGWRLFALFGADWVRGDWLTAWELFDLFLLLIFTVAVYRLWGLPAGVVAFLGFALAYHESGTPSYLWFFLLIPVALLRVVPEGAIRKWVVAWKYVAATILILWLIPFFTGQIQSILYPQLEKRGAHYGSPQETYFYSQTVQTESAPVQNRNALSSVSGVTRQQAPAKDKMWKMKQNMAYDSKAKIQTGPGIPEWQWNSIQFGWKGPVTAGQEIRPVFISLNGHRFLTVLRLGLIVLLFGILMNIRHLMPPMLQAGGKLGVLLAGVFLLGGMPASAQIPDSNLLNELKQRLTKPAEVYPNAADIARVDLTVGQNSVTMEAEIHTGDETAVPLPGRLQGWSPVRVRVNGSENVALKRFDDYLWIVLPKGVNRVQVEGLLPNASEWEWSFLLRPRRVEIEAPGWTVTGVRENGRPEGQVFFVKQARVASEEAAYDRKDFNPIVVVDRYLEIGLVWQVRTVVSRLSPAGKAVALQIPLLPGEQVLTNEVVSTENEGMADVRLGAQQSQFSWNSEIQIQPEIPLEAVDTNQWVERWHLQTSPVWNVSLSGLAPIFEQEVLELNPVWHPWPGEAVTLQISRPESVSGATVTVKKNEFTTEVGLRQEKSTLNLDIECSLGEDFNIQIPEGAEVLTLERNGSQMPVRQDGSKVIVPLQPGTQTLKLVWTLADDLSFQTRQQAVELPVESANVKHKLQLPSDRWILWTWGPQQGPAVRFWPVVLCALLGAWLLSKLTLSPLNLREWILLALGLTQVHISLSLIVVGWLFLLAWRGREALEKLPPWGLNTLQVFLLLLTVGALGAMLAIVSEGLLGRPEMFILGNGSYGTNLNWFAPRAGEQLLQPGALSVSIWIYRILMLLWALWLALALIRWLRWGWDQFREGGYWIRKAETATTPPSLPKE